MSQKVRHSQIATYIPNLIGYARFFFLALCPLWAFDKEKFYLAGICYFMSYFLDVFDGMAARAFNQCSRYGAALDQICDRATNSCIYMFLSVMYPTVSFLFFLCFLLDFGAHWLQFQSTAFLKSESHKGKNAKENWLVSLYYNNSTLFQIVVGGAELGTGLLFVFGVYPWLWDILPLAALEVVLLVILTFKMYVNVHQWTGATDRFRENQHKVVVQNKESESPAKTDKSKSKQ